MAKIEELLTVLVPDGEYITHVDVIVATRSMTDSRRGSYQRFPAPGADPLMSLGALLASLDELRVRLNPNLALIRPREN